MTVGAMIGDGAARWPRARHDPAAVDMKYVLGCIFFLSISMGIWQFASDNAERYAWLLADFTCALLLWRYQSQFINLAMSNVVFMCWPLLALASVVWSVAPGGTLYHALQLLMTTFVAFLICIKFRLEQFIAIIFWAMLAAAIVALGAALLQPSVGIDFVGNWRGGFPTKNVLGDAMVLLVISGCCLFLQGRWRLITAAAIALGVFLIFMTRSATPILSLFLTLAPLPFAYALLRGPAPFMILLGLTCVLASMVALGAYVAIVYFDVDPIGIVLASVGKERTLTGRTLLWQVANWAIESKPWLGYGFKGYWADPPAEMLQIRASFGQRINFFHNNFLEVAVAYGVIGPILLALGIAIAFIRAVLRVIYAVQPVDIWPLLLTILVIIQVPVQNPLMVNHSFWHVLFIVAAVIRR